MKNKNRKEIDFNDDDDEKGRSEQRRNICEEFL